MKTPLFALAFAAGLVSQTASGADLPTLKSPTFQPPTNSYSWTGFYAGTNSGTGWADPTGGLLPLAPFPAGYGAPAAVAGGFIPSGLSVGPDGPVAGGQIGYLWRTGSWVLGAETDFQGSLIAGSTTINFPGVGGFAPSVTTASERLEWFGTARGRFGWLAEPNILFYGTGGLAYGETRESYYLAGVPPTAGTLAGSTNATRIGWAAGGGAEWKMTNNISFTLEYLRVDLGSSTLMATDQTGIFPGLFLDYRFHNAYNIIRSGMNYQFDLFNPPATVAKY
jgi:outer membrane immunogenic protein